MYERSIAEAKACEGIPTAALTPGLVGEMMEALADAREGLRLVGNSMTEKTESRIADILAKLGK